MNTCLKTYAETVHHNRPATIVLEDLVVSTNSASTGESRRARLLLERDSVLCNQRHQKPQRIQPSEMRVPHTHPRTRLLGRVSYSNDT